MCSVFLLVVFVLTEQAAYSEGNTSCAYAVSTEDGELIFYRSFNEYDEGINKETHVHVHGGWHV